MTSTEKKVPTCVMCSPNTATVYVDEPHEQTFLSKSASQHRLSSSGNGNYIFCHFFRVLVNVVKYKLDHMRRRIEMDERDSTNRASFRCPNCCSTFTDLEANQLFDPMTGKNNKKLN